MADVFVRYIGKKPWTVDFIGGTGTIWNGNGDIQPVPAEVAEKLMNHPDQWELVEGKRPQAAAPKQPAAAPKQPAAAPKKGKQAAPKKGKQAAPAPAEPEPVKTEEPVAPTKDDGFEA